MRAAFHTIEGNDRWGFPTIDEIINELAGIFIKHGRIKLAPNKYCDLNYDQTKLDSLKQFLEAEIDKRLQQSVGKVITDE